MRFLSSSSCKDLEEETLSLCITRYELGRGDVEGRTYGEYQAGVGDKRRGPPGRRATVERGLLVWREMGDGTYW